MPFMDMPRYFVPPTGVRGSGGILGGGYGRPRSIMAPTANPLTGAPANDPWNGRTDAADMQPPPISRGLPAGPRPNYAPDYTKPGSDTLKKFQALLDKYKLQSMQDAMAAARQANESYGLFPTGVGLGLGFQRPYMDIASDQGRHVRGFEILKNALENPAPPVTIEAKNVGRNTHSTADFIEALDNGQNFDPRSLSLADRDAYKIAVQIKAQRDAQRSRGGGF